MNAHREIDEPSVVDIRALHMDFQAPECLNEEDVQRYGADLENGVPFEPIIVCFDGASLFLKDGFHRVEAARRRGLTELTAEILPGTLEQMEEEYRSMVVQAMAELRRTSQFDLSAESWSRDRE